MADKTDAFDTFLNTLNADAEPAPVASQPEPVAVDPYAHLIGCIDPHADRDPFALLLDGMLAAEGVSNAKDVEPLGFKNPNMESHEWEAKADKEIIYSDDQALWMCHKCFRQMYVGREETLTSAMGRHKISISCATQLACEVMSV